MPKTKPFFSIIIPTLNESKYLPHLLNDLSKQTFRDFEVIVADGKSTDSTVKLAKTYHTKLPSLQVLTSPTRHVCTQRNLGAKHAAGPVLIFADADCRLDPSFILGLKYRWETSGADILTCWLKPDVINPTNESVALATNLFFELQNNLKPRYLLESLFAIRSNCFHQIGGFNETINYAEGKSLIQSAAELGFTSKIVRDPTYVFSFRRLRKYGVLGVAGRAAKLELAELFGKNYHTLQAEKLYPMLGGSTFARSNKAKNKFLKNITKLIKDF